MSTQWTPEQIIALAPDPASAKNGRSLAGRHKWVQVGIQESVIWGECQGSGKDPYRTQIDLNEPAFKCSCPSRKFPCKHGLGLFLLWAEKANEFAGLDLPDWVSQWIASRSQRVEKQAQKQAEKQEKAADPAAQAKRATERQRKVTAGIQELRLWLEDQVRQGLATAPQNSYQVWDGIAARMVDAQAPGLARRLRDLAGVVQSGQGWSDRLLAQLGELYLLTEGFARLESLPPAVQADLRTQMGWTFNQDEVLSEAGQADLWLIVGQRLEVEDRLKVRRTWLLGLKTGQAALLLDFAHGAQPFEMALALGHCVEAELVFYPSAYPLRALIKTRQETVPLTQDLPGYQGIAEAIAAYGQAFALCPWLEQFPLLVQSVVPLRDGDRWLLRDQDNLVMPLVQGLEPKQGWQLLALSGGYPVTVFGEWSQQHLLPLSVWVEDRFYGFGN